MDYLRKRFNQFADEGDEVEVGGEEVAAEIEEEKMPRKKVFSRLASMLLLVSFFLLPIIFIPIQSVNFLFTKQLLYATTVLFAFGVWALLRLKNGDYELPQSPMVFALGAVVIATFLSALFSGFASGSLLGQGFEVGTAVSVLVGFLAVFIVPLYFTDKDKIFSAYVMIFGSFAILALFEIVRLLIGPSVFSFGIFTDITSNLLGKWNDLAVFFGFTTVLSLVTIEFFPTGKSIKVLSYAVLIVSLLILAVVNLSTIWLALGLFSVVLFVYLYSFSRHQSTVKSADRAENPNSPSQTFPVATLIVVIVSILFIIAGNYIGNTLTSAFNITQIEVRPSWQSTLAVAKGTLGQQPLLGAGPNQFVSEWLKYKDPSINSTIFWNTDFTYGIGLIPTYIVETGLLGTIAWLIFLGLFLYSGFRAIFLPSNDKVLRYLTISSFLGTLFLWIFNIFHSPGNVIVALTFLMTGLFVAALVQEGMVKIKTGSYTVNSKLSFMTVLGLIVIIAITVSVMYFLIQRYVSYVYFQRGAIILNETGNVDQSESKLLKAVSISRDDVFYRALTEIGIIRMGNLLSSATKDTPQNTLISQFQNILGTTLNYASEAININPSNYQNWVERGRVYEAVVPLKIDGAYEAAAAAYKEALKYDPLNPSLYLMLARLEFTKGDNDKSKEFITQALTAKGNYTDAIFLLAQIQIKQGNVSEAIKSVEAASVLTPNDPSILFQLGLLQFDNKDYKDAAASLERAIAISPQYANAKYYLGLAYDKLGMDKEALAQFTDLKQTNPDNKEIQAILDNLKAGKSALANTTAPTNQPDKRTKPPINETPTKSKTN